MYRDILMMGIMKIFANGCSFTWGGEILEEERGLSNTLTKPVDDENTRFRESSVWPARLDALMGNPGFVNLGMGYGSNARITRTTLEYFLSRQQAGEDVSDHIAVIQWTEPSRYEVYDADAGTWLLIKNGVVLPEVGDDRYDDLQSRLVEDGINHVNDMFNHMVGLSAFLGRWGVRHMFTSLMPVDFNHEYQLRYCRDNMVWFMGDPSRCLSTPIYDRRFKYGSDHPNPEGHARIAEAMHEQMRDLGWC